MTLLGSERHGSIEVELQSTAMTIKCCPAVNSIGKGLSPHQQFNFYDGDAEKRLYSKRDVNKGNTNQVGLGLRIQEPTLLKENKKYMSIMSIVPV